MPDPTHNIARSRETVCYVFLVEVSADKDQGAFVRCYIASTDFRIAMKRVIECLQEDGWSYVDVEFGAKDDSVDWDDPDHLDAKEYRGQALAIPETVVFGRMDTWDNREENLLN